MSGQITMQRPMLLRGVQFFVAVVTVLDVWSLSAPWRGITIGILRVDSFLLDTNRRFRHSFSRHGCRPVLKCWSQLHLSRLDPIANLSSDTSFSAETEIETAKPEQQQQQQQPIEVDSLKDNNPLGLTPELLRMTSAFEAIGDDKLRYKQLLFLANQLPPMDSALQIPSNKVPGCLSTVYVHATCDDNKIHYVGDSDGLLTKGLVALLVRGLSNNTAHAIQQVDPAFISAAGLSTSLTPGRNNGFLNMLAVMKQQALQLEQAARDSSSEYDTNKNSMDKDTSSTGSSSIDTDMTTTEAATAPKYTAIVAALQALKPTVLELKDVSYQHAGHAGMNGVTDEETHFELYIVADAFDGLNLVKRHKLVYMMLGNVMPQIHALQIQAKTPSEIL
jgi:BolA-like protein 1